jgi:hypothetical protein
MNTSPVARPSKTRRTLLAAAVVLATLGSSAASVVFPAKAAFASPAGAQPWWQHDTMERTLNAVNNGQTLQDVQNNLATYRAQGYQVIDLDWPVSAGPTSIYNGFSASDYMNVDPRLAAPSTDPDTDWTNFVAAAHSLGMEVTSWFNPSYMWTGSALFEQAEADVATYGPVRANQPADSPARYFDWAATSGHDSKPTGPYGSFASDWWVQDPAASWHGETISYQSEWSDMPSGDFASAQWDAYIGSVLNHWIGTGIDGFMFDAPENYLDCDASCVQTNISDVVHSHANVAAFAEEPNDISGNTQDGFDATASPTFYEDPPSVSQPWIDAVNSNNPSGIETSATIQDRDRRAGVGGTDVESFNPADLNNDTENLLALATAAGSGEYITVYRPSVAPTFGDFTTWPDSSIAPAVKAISDAVSYNAALNVTAPRTVLSTSNSAKFYAVLRTSNDGLTNAIEVFNYQSTPQTIVVTLPSTVASGATTDLLSGGTGPSVSSNTVTVSLGGWGYTFLGTRAIVGCTTQLCHSTYAPSTLTPLAALGSSDWAHWGATGGSAEFDHDSVGDSQITNTSNVGSLTAPVGYCSTVIGSSWFSGTPSAVADDDGCGIYYAGNGNGYSFTVPASTTQRTLYIYLGVWETSGTLTASINDGSGTSYTYPSLTNLSGTTNEVYQLTYHATSGGKLLTVSFVQSAATGGNITLQGAALAVTTPTALGGALSGTTATPAGTTNLTTEGTTDWMHWGSTSSATEYDFKATGGNQIDDVAVVPSTSGVGDQYYCGSAATFSWTDGYTNGSGSSDGCGLYVTGPGGGFRVTVPADKTSRTLHIYLGVWFASATVSAVLSDSGAAPYTSTALSNSGGTTNLEYMLTYQAASSGQSLTVVITDTNAYTSPYGPGNVTIQAADLS